MSFLLEEFRLRGDPQRPLFGLPVETSDRVIADINRYTEDLPIVFGSVIGGPDDSPVIEWDAPLLEVAREGLLMAGRRRFVPTIEQLGLRIDDLGALEGIPIAPGYETLRVKTATAARRIIEDAADDLLEDLLLPTTELESTPSNESADLFPNLLERLFRLRQGTSDGDDTETEPE